MIVCTIGIVSSPEQQLSTVLSAQYCIKIKLQIVDLVNTPTSYRITMTSFTRIENLISNVLIQLLSLSI